MYSILFLIIAPTFAVLAGMTVALFVPGAAMHILLISSATLLYGFAQYYTVYRPTLTIHRETRSKIIQCILSDLHRELINTIDCEPDCPKIRLSVMSVAGRRNHKYLKMISCTFGYSAAEIEMKLGAGQGAAGLAWEQKTQIVGNAKVACDTLNITQREICRHIRCMLCTPIKPRNRQIRAILVVDSTIQSIQRLRLDSSSIRYIVQVYADMISELY